MAGRWPVFERHIFKIQNRLKVKFPCGNPFAASRWILKKSLGTAHL